MMLTIDTAVNAIIPSIQTPSLTKLMIIITGIGSTTCLAILSILLLILLIYKKRYHQSLLLAFGMLGGLLIELFIKAIIQRERPESMLIAETGYSFPSAHAMMALVFFAILMYTVKDDLKNAFLRYLFIAVSICIVLLVAFSRLYLGVHWLSDVIGGLIIGAIWLLLLILIFKSKDLYIK